jgi:TPP-dependent trihydroxycyclohexane-1,2-dione (THcHDO) dehydratase
MAVAWGPAERQCRIRDHRTSRPEQVKAVALAAVRVLERPTETGTCAPRDALR